MLPALALLALTAPPATAAPVADSPHLWATVNVCDSAGAAPTVGVRASMPRLRGRSVPFMRFRVQYQDAAGGWRFVGGPSADSGLMRPKSGDKRRHESGWTFGLALRAGERVLTRGHVTFVWRRGARVVRRLSEVTEAGHPSLAGARPPKFSAAFCELG